MAIEIAVVIQNSGDATSHYRGYGPMNALKKSYGVNIKRLAQVTWTDLSDCDIVYLQRPHTNEHLAVILLAKSCGVKVWCDFDDLLCGLTSDNPAFDYFNAFAKNVVQAITLADHVTVSSQFLLDEYSKYNKSISVVPNAWDDFVHPHPFEIQKQRSLGNRSVFWRGTDTHIKDLYDVKDEILSLSKQSAWSFMGFCPWFLRGAGQKINPMDIINYMAFMQSIKFDVVAVPLHDSPFNRAKSNIAFLEGAVAGAVCVAPDFAEWNRPGVVIYGKEKSFTNAVLEALELSQSGTNWGESRNYIQNFLMLSNVNGKRIAVAEELSGKKRG